MCMWHTFLAEYEVTNMIIQYAIGYLVGGSSGFGSGYGGNYGGGAMKSAGYSQRGAGPYGGLL